MLSNMLIGELFQVPRPRHDSSASALASVPVVAVEHEHRSVVAVGCKQPRVLAALHRAFSEHHLFPAVSTGKNAVTAAGDLFRS